jgi:hypothetical protein
MISVLSFLVVQAFIETPLFLSFFLSNFPPKVSTKPPMMPGSYQIVVQWSTTWAKSILLSFTTSATPVLVSLLYDSSWGLLCHFSECHYSFAGDAATFEVEGTKMDSPPQGFSSTRIILLLSTYYTEKNGRTNDNNILKLK